MKYIYKLPFTFVNTNTLNNLDVWNRFPQEPNRVYLNKVSATRIDTREMKQYQDVCSLEFNSGMTLFSYHTKYWAKLECWEIADQLIDCLHYYLQNVGEVSWPSPTIFRLVDPNEILTFTNIFKNSLFDWFYLTQFGDSLDSESAAARPKEHNIITVRQV